MSMNLFLQNRLGNKTKLKHMTLDYIMKLSRIPPHQQDMVELEMDTIIDEVAKYVRSYIAGRNQNTCIKSFSNALVIGLVKYGDRQLSYPYNDRVSPHDLATKAVYEKIKEKV